MTVMEHAQALGVAISEDPVAVELKAAQTAYDTCEGLQKKLTEYNAQRAVMGEEFRKEVEKQDPVMLEMVKARIETLGREIVAFPEYARLAEAQKALQALIAKVNSEISYAVFGVRPDEGCTHDCASCSGCH